MSDTEKRDARIADRIRRMIGIHGRLNQHAAALQVSVENAVVVLRGKLPTQELKRELNAVIRQAGVLFRIDNAIDTLSP